jgi:hypothetical protein
MGICETPLATFVMVDTIFTLRGVEVEGGSGKLPLKTRTMGHDKQIMDLESL